MSRSRPWGAKEVAARVAEIELESAGQTFERPDWIGAEVTDDARYFNSQLSVNPFSQWAGKD